MTTRLCFMAPYQTPAPPSQTVAINGSVQISTGIPSAYIALYGLDEIDACIQALTDLRTLLTVDPAPRERAEVAL